jgi:hypothetical protein
MNDKLRAARDAFDYQFSTLEGLAFILHEICYHRLDGSIHAKDGALMALADVISAKVVELAELRSAEGVAAAKERQAKQERENATANAS